MGARFLEKGAAGIISPLSAARQFTVVEFARDYDRGPETGDRGL